MKRPQILFKVQGPPQESHDDDQRAFDQQLMEQPPASGTERHPHGQLTLPIDERSTFIRTHFTATRFTRGRPEYETSTVLDPIEPLVSAFTRGDLRSYGGVLWRPQAPTR